MLQNILDSMNPAQCSAVISDAKVLQILAGPGSGKTRVLTTRVAYLVKEKQVDPASIMVVTFTNKAANEMRKRLLADDLLGEISNKLMMGTFHASCSSFLRRYGKAIGLNPNFSIADTAVTIKIIDEVMKETKVKGKSGYFRSQISKAKCQGIDCDEFQARHGNDNKFKDTCIIYMAYQKQLKKDNALDFDDLLMVGCRLLEKSPNISWSLNHILVDEYQDTNTVQYDLLKLLMNGQKSLTIVGDPDQSIYGFRNADVTNFLKMKQEYNNVQTIRLEQNYRSTTKILDAVSVVINNDESRIPKKLFTDNCDGLPMSWLQYKEPEDEAEAIVSEILRVQKYTKGVLTNEDFSILIRINSFTLHFERALSRNKIPYRVRGGIRFFDRAEIKDMLAYLRLIANPNDSDAFVRIINVPKRGVGDVTLKRVKAIADDNGLNMIEALAELAGSNGTRTNNTSQRSLNGPTLKNVREFLQMFDAFRVLNTAKASAGNIVEAILTATDMKAYLKHKHVNDGEKKWEEHWANIEELLDYAHRFTDSSTNESNNDNALSPLVRFLDSASLDIDETQKGEDDGVKQCVTISTYHSAKGLEWPCVFTTGCEDGILPYNRCQTKEEIQEECRLLYVGMTRAQCFLYCTEVLRRHNPWRQQWEDSTTTRFLKDMPANLYQAKYPRIDRGVREWIATLLNRLLPEEDDSLVDEGHFRRPARLPILDELYNGDDPDAYDQTDHDDYYRAGSYMALINSQPRYTSSQSNSSQSGAAVYQYRRTSTFGAAISSKAQTNNGFTTVRSKAQPSSQLLAQTSMSSRSSQPYTTPYATTTNATAQPLYECSPFTPGPQQHDGLTTRKKIRTTAPRHLASGSQATSLSSPTQPYSGFTTASEVHKKTKDTAVKVEDNYSQPMPQKWSKASSSKGKKAKVIKEEPVVADLDLIGRASTNDSEMKQEAKEEANGYKSIWARFLKKEGDELSLRRRETELSAMILDCLQRIPNERGELTGEQATSLVAENVARKNMAISRMDIEFRVNFELEKLVNQGILYRKADVYIIAN